jgi:hypothetical protein
MQILDEGVMERTYLDYLLRHDELLLALGGDQTFTALTEFGLNNLMYNYLDVKGTFFAVAFYNCRFQLTLCTDSRRQ